MEITFNLPFGTPSPELWGWVGFIIIYSLLLLLVIRFADRFRADDKLDAINNRLVANERLLERTHSMVFDKAEQIIRFHENFIKNELDDMVKMMINRFVKENSVNEVQSSNIIWAYGKLEAMFSDWNVVVEGEDTETEYSIHRYILGARSGYFSQVFQTWSAGPAPQTTVVSLGQLTSDLFPLFLDFLYTGKIEIGNWNAVPLYWMADYFDVPSLKKEVKEKISPIKDTESCLVYINHAFSLNCIELIELEVDKFCYRNPLSATIVNSTIQARRVKVDQPNGTSSRHVLSPGVESLDSIPTH